MIAMELAAFALRTQGLRRVRSVLVLDYTPPEHVRIIALRDGRPFVSEIVKSEDVVWSRLLQTDFIEPVEIQDAT